VTYAQAQAAAMIAESEYNSQDERYMVAKEFVRFFKLESSNFNELEFLEACGCKSE
jgi:hypothetical protein